MRICPRCGSTEPLNQYRQCKKCKYLAYRRWFRKNNPCKKCSSTDVSCECTNANQRWFESHCKNCRGPVVSDVYCDACTETMKMPLKKSSPQEIFDRCVVIPGVEQTCSEIARQMGISYERVRQIEEEALSKLYRNAVRMRVER